MHKMLHAVFAPQPHLELQKPLAVCQNSYCVIGLAPLPRVHGCDPWTPGGSAMFSKKCAVLVIFFSLAAVFCSTSTQAQTPSNCKASQADAVECFVANAVSTGLAKPTHGMTLAQYEQYGVAVNSILQTNHTYIVLLGLSSAVADSMPPTNANGSENSSAQNAAVGVIVTAAVSDHLISLPAGVSVTQLQYFCMDIVAAMNDNSGYLALLTPGVSFRMVDSYVVSSTVNGTVNWSDVNSGLAAAVNNLIKSGLIKVPSGVTAQDIEWFSDAMAKAIYTYKTSTGRKTL
jgi:hypothetical protein